MFCLPAWVLNFITNLKMKSGNEKLDLDKFVSFSEVNCC